MKFTTILIVVLFDFMFERSSRANPGGTRTMATTKTPLAKKTLERQTPAPAAEPIHIEAAARTDWSRFEPVPVSPEQRRRMIQDAAYFRAEQRDFSHGDPVQDWVEAELEVDRLLRGEPGSGC
jgi:hypothetical protein